MFKNKITYLIISGLVILFCCLSSLSSSENTKGERYEDLFEYSTEWKGNTSDLVDKYDSFLPGSTPEFTSTPTEIPTSAPTPTPTIHNPYTAGRAVGIHAVASVGNEEYTTDEVELIITDPVEGTKQPIQSPSKTKSLKVFPNTNNKCASPQEIYQFFEKTVKEYERLAATDHEFAASGKDMVYGSAAPEIGTFLGWTLWIGWAGSWSDSYTPECESRAWVVYFAPEGIYVALQWAKSVYSNVDIFAGISAFYGALVSPSGDILTRDYINSLMGVSISIDTMIADVGPTFFRVGTDGPLIRGIQFNVGKSISYGLIPISLPFSVTLDNESGMTNIDGGGGWTGFYPIVEWDVGTLQQENPINTVVRGLEQLAANTGETYIDLTAKQTARILLPFFQKHQTSGTITLEDDVPPPDNATYFGEFLQSTSPGSSANTSIDHMIDKADQWLQSGDTNQLGDAVSEYVNHSLDSVLFIQDMNTIRGGTQMAYQLGYKRGYDSTGRTDTIYADCVKTVTCEVNEWCSLEVTAKEISELVEGTTPQDFEGITVWFQSEGAISWEGVPIEEGSAVYWFIPNSDSTMIFDVQIDPTSITNDKTLELCRQIVTPIYEAGATIHSDAFASGDNELPYNGNAGSYGAGIIRSGSAAKLSVSITDDNGRILMDSASVGLYDYAENLIAGPVETLTGLASFEFIPQPSIPQITDFYTTEIGYTPETARTGYALQGIGISKDADVLFNGTSINNMNGWVWQINGSKEILFLPPEGDENLFSVDTTVQVVNPESINSNEYVYSP